MTAEPNAWTVERHLDGQPAFAVDLYHRFIELVETIGPFHYAVSKSSITLKGTRRGFAGAKPTPTGLRGYFDVQRAIEDPRITAVSPYTARLYVHHFRIAEPHELDDEFAGWMHEAYDVGAGGHIRA